MDFRGKNIDLVGKMKLWFGLSVAVMILGLIGVLMPPAGLNLGIDFKGGSQFTYRLPEKSRPQGGQETALLGKINDNLQSVKLIGTRTQIAGGQDLVVNTSAQTDSEANTQERIVSGAVAKALGIASIKPEGRQQVGAIIGDELRSNAIKGVVLGVLCIAAWIYIRYNFAGDGLRYAVAGIVALVHDVIVLIGIFALIGKIDPRVEIDSGFIAALLTVVGYSINDSVVIFDRLRENLRIRRGETFDKIVNDSLLETMSRSINTGLTVLIMLFVLLMFGGESIYNFTLAMLIGIASGLYSSIFNASMVLVAWNRWEEKRAARLKGERDASRTNISVRETSRGAALKTRAK
ncbi:protein translocase subunit secF [Abditibacterium utsteinense]|uniref:Protein-export membrane protein SecF n=1 Tax=Abditibacterium utsteinense TaxID=1960156 RepID=A0A2S8SVY3_9BACT|nr:protein translocase subunit SecF [Abditibacterium utsteinense]PQV64948.1 protein translocase subunit secF [Abditibacterium utsteinense]